MIYLYRGEMCDVWVVLVKNVNINVCICFEVLKFLKIFKLIFKDV